MTTILYGCGKFYSVNKAHILKAFEIDYICDQKLDNSETNVYDGIPIIKTADVYQMENIRVIICAYSMNLINEIKECFIEKEKIEFIFYKKIITGEELLKDFSDGVYEDILGNTVKFDETLPKSIQIYLLGYDNKLVLGTNFRVKNELKIIMGCKGIISIGDKTTFDEVRIDCTWGSVEIGNDCMLSWEVHIRNDDGHHIFDMTTGERLNPCGNITIGNHCWIGQGCLLLKNINIGSGSIIGGKSVVTKSVPSNAIAAGNPAKVVKEGICWERNWTKIENIQHIEDIKKYFKI